ncbi:ABC transporter permease [Planomicrobium sp. CPCC 101079]|uniref:ABC transporter permease n=1 Tax=Planomicrobium sp. CPCC 101079 TaxID=2599618 RepID=UPI0011B38685|nr:ABC transporter permease [Planomicrobium sp. CPCC 101079]TWT01625.1 ABC transporter permease [Planomicrobium sp. CPCC 101079]
MEAARRNIELLNVQRSLKKNQRSLFIKRFLANKQIVFGSITLFLLVLFALLGPMLTSYDPYAMVVTERLQAPSSTHWFGTDNFGRDLFSRVVIGAQVSLGVGLTVAVLSSVIGLVIGLYASYYRVLDHVFMRICDGLMSIPAILLAIAFMAALGPNTTNIIVALTVVFSPYVARIVRSSALVVREQTYIEAMKAQGAKSWRIIFRHIAPNTISPLFVQASFIFADAIITEAGLSFLGAGIPTPDPSWGNILSDGKSVIYTAWWMVVFPGAALILAVLSTNLLGDGLRDLLDPHVTSNKKIKYRKNKLLKMGKAKV